MNSIPIDLESLNESIDTKLDVDHHHLHKPIEQEQHEMIEIPMTNEVKLR